METKQCKKCTEIKPVTEFYKKRDTKDRLTTWCKICVQKQSRNHILNNPEKSKEYSKKWQLKNPEKFKQQTTNYLTKIKAVYEIIDNDTNECLYIGQSKRFISRKNHHKRRIESIELSKKCKQAYLYDLLRQHPQVNIRIIEECSPEVLIEREQYYIDTKKPLYNKL